METLLPAPESGKNDKILVCCGLVYEYNPKPGAKTSRAGIHFIVTDVLEPDEDVFSASILQYDSDGQPYWATPGGSAPWQIGKVLGVMPFEEVINACIRGWEIMWKGPCPAETLERFKLAAKKPPKLLSIKR